MEHSTSLPELAEAFFAALTLWASGCCVYFLTVHADLTDFDPRPAVYRLLDSDPGARLVMAVHRVHRAVQDVCRDAAALLILLTTSPKGAMAS